MDCLRMVRRTRVTICRFCCKKVGNYYNLSQKVEFLLIDCYCFAKNFVYLHAISGFSRYSPSVGIML